jgi:hypothetical protein
VGGAAQLAEEEGTSMIMHACFTFRIEETGQVPSKKGPVSSASFDTLDLDYLCWGSFA